MRTFDDVAPGEDAESVRRSLGIGRYSRDGAHLPSPRHNWRGPPPPGAPCAEHRAGWRAWLAPAL